MQINCSRIIHTHIIPKLWILELAELVYKLFINWTLIWSSLVAILCAAACPNGPTCLCRPTYPVYMLAVPRTCQTQVRDTLSWSVMYSYSRICHIQVTKGNNIMPSSAAYRMLVFYFKVLVKKMIKFQI